MQKNEHSYVIFSARAIEFLKSIFLKFSENGIKLKLSKFHEIFESVISSEEHPIPWRDFESLVLVEDDGNEKFISLNAWLALWE